MFVKQEIIDLVNKNEKELQDKFNEIKSICEYNTEKVLKAFQNNNLSEVHFNQSTGYGYNDIGRETIEKIYSEIFTTEDALVRGQFISASHALNVTLFGLLRPNDTLMYITGTPYDTLHEVIGIKENKSSLKSYNVNYKEIDLIDNDFNYEEIKNNLDNVKVVAIQRSRGYSTRESLGIKKIEKVIKFIKEINKDIIIFIDNCYCEFVEKTNPLEVGADIIVGSLIKNLGGGIATNGGYVAGKHELIELIAERLTVPGQGKEVGPTNANRMFLQGLYFAPSVVASALKTSILTSYVLEKLGFDVSPKYNDIRADIVQTIIFKNPDKLIKYAEAIQASSAIDSNVVPIPDDMPGYDDKIIMASGSFTQGSSIELSCDGPLREPYILYQQGGITYEYGKLALINALEKIKDC